MMGPGDFNDYRVDHSAAPYVRSTDEIKRRIERINEKRGNIAKSMMLVSGEIFSLNRSRTAIINTTEQVKQSVRRKMTKKSQSTGSANFNHKQFFPEIYTGFITASSDEENYLYSFLGKVRVPLIRSRATLEIITPRCVFEIKRGGVLAGVVPTDENNTSLSFPFSNTYHETYAVGLMSRSSDSFRRLCLGSALENQFHNSVQSGRVNTIPRLVTAIFTSNANTDLALNAGVGARPLSQQLNSALRQNKIAKSDVKLMSLYFEQLKSRLALDGDNFHYDTMIALIATFTRYAPEIVDSIWNKAICNQHRQNAASAHEILNILKGFE